MSSTPVLAHSATKPRRLGQRIRLSELPIREVSYDLFADLAANRAKWSFRYFVSGGSGRRFRLRLSSIETVCAPHPIRHDTAYIVSRSEVIDLK
jgi:hypothetical protein